MDQQVPTEASAEVRMLIHPTQDWYFLSGTQNRGLIIFLAPNFHLFTFDLFRNQLPSQITPLQRYKPEM